MAAGPTSPSDRPTMAPPPMLLSDSVAKDAILAWFRGEFAAANAIIDALCAHLATSTHDYDAAFTAIHRRRLNWIPVLQMQKYHSIADITLELRRVSDRNHNADDQPKSDDKTTSSESVVGNGAADEHEEYESPESEITDSGE